ncbi:MAG TPA: isoprenylcysteine carboxylmethyltransferase family protein [Vicinamibacterales bacterium]|nr:isoprenylcysteine carboxylmethyltransferase family protein [Vicinamibacterales bacterium]
MTLLPQTPLDWVLLAVALATAIVIAVAMQDFFLDARANSPRTRALQDLGVAIAVTHFGVIVLRGSAGPNWAIAGIAMYVAATLLFLSALEAARRVPLPRTFVDDPMPKALVTRGPFAIIRHPFYLSYSIAWLAAPVATHGPLIALAALFMISLYVIAARREERALEDRFGEAYRTYKNGTGMVIPSLAHLLASRTPH